MTAVWMPSQRADACVTRLHPSVFIYLLQTYAGSSLQKVWKGTELEGLSKCCSHSSSFEWQRHTAERVRWLPNNHCEGRRWEGRVLVGVAVRMQHSPRAFPPVTITGNQWAFNPPLKHFVSAIITQVWQDGLCEFYWEPGESTPEGIFPLI